MLFALRDTIKADNGDLPDSKAEPFGGKSVEMHMDTIKADNRNLSDSKAEPFDEGKGMHIISEYDWTENFKYLFTLKAEEDGLSCSLKEI